VTRERVAVIGSGVAGLTAAWVISKSADVTLYEADERLGGHADTHDVTLEGDTHAVDTGFIVHNDRTYPVLTRLFDELGVDTRPSEMSLSVRDDRTGVQWAGALGVRGLFPNLRMALHPEHLRMLVEIPRFHRRAKRLLRSSTEPASAQTMDEFLRDGRFSSHFRRHFMEPLIAAVWSCDPQLALRYPAEYLFTFLHHHGMLRVFGSPRWRTIVGGSRTYVDKMATAVDDVRVGTKVTCVVEERDGVHITDSSGTTTQFVAAVIATHPLQALGFLGAPTLAQMAVLAWIPYSRNEAILHTDTSLLPSAVRARAAWNFLRRDPSTGEDAVGLTVTYDLSRLQDLSTTSPLLLTLGGSGLVDEADVLARMEYEHPLYSPTSVAARRQLPGINTKRLAFAGAYHGWGFHEDGARSGLAAAEHLGFTWGPALGPYRTTIRHTRRAPFIRTFTHRSHLWLVDVDVPPAHGRRSAVLGSVEARDHLGDPDASIRANVESFLMDAGQPFSGGRILLATQPRAWGRCFNPISVFWCFEDSGQVAATIVEVHNTYGDRHAYLVDADENGRGEVDKKMYVSPFHGTDGFYTVVAPVPSHRLQVAVTLHTEDGATFTASVSGEPLRGQHHPAIAALATLRGSALIRLHGIWLWMRRLPIQPRPAHHQPGVST
jgi:predicted NAD/FAD-binding protein/DUF1365 family protein